MSYYGKKGFVNVFQFPNLFSERMHRCNCRFAQASNPGAKKQTATIFYAKGALEIFFLRQREVDH